MPKFLYFLLLVPITFLSSFQLTPRAPFVRAGGLEAMKKLRIDDFEDQEQNSVTFEVCTEKTSPPTLLSTSHVGFASLSIDTHSTAFLGQSNNEDFKVTVEIDYHYEGSITEDFKVTRMYSGFWENVAGDVWSATGKILDEKERLVGYFNALEEVEEVEVYGF